MNRAEARYLAETGEYRTVIYRTLDLSSMTSSPKRDTYTKTKVTGVLTYEEAVLVVIVQERWASARIPYNLILDIV